MKRQKLSLPAIMKLFPDDSAAEQWFILSRWPDGIICPWCQSERISERNSTKWRSWRCMPCGKNFTAKTNSLMHASNIGFRVWAIAMYLVTTNLKGVASTKLASDVSITQKSAWHLSHRIRTAYAETNPGPMTGELEIDETWIGGKERNKHESKKIREGRGPTGKQAVMGMKSRDTKRISAQCVKTVSTTVAYRFIAKHSDWHGSTLYTDQNSSYRIARRMGYRHQSVNHSANEFVRDMAHTNGIEGFWAMLKRGVNGTFHSLSVKHLQRYVNEFAGRSNVRTVRYIQPVGDDGAQDGWENAAV